MRNGMIGGFLGVMVGALVLASCGFGGVDFDPPAQITQSELDARVAPLQQRIADLTAQLDAEEAELDAHAADTVLHDTVATPALALNYCIALVGAFPNENLTESSKIAGGDVSTGLSSNPYIGSVALFAGSFAPRGWALCEGQLLSIAQNTALFSILGTTYGGDGESTFALPDLRQRAAAHPESGFALGATRN